MASFLIPIPDDILTGIIEEYFNSTDRIRLPINANHLRGALEAYAKKQKYLGIEISIDEIMAAVSDVLTSGKYHKRLTVIAASPSTPFIQFRGNNPAEGE